MHSRRTWAEIICKQCFGQNMTKRNELVACTRFMVAVLISANSLHVYASNSFHFERITKVIIIITEIALGLTEFQLFQIEYALQINAHSIQRFIRSAIKINWLYYRITFRFQVNGAYNFSIIYCFFFFCGKNQKRKCTESNLQNPSISFSTEFTIQCDKILKIFAVC